ncbi:pilus assembly protein PilM [Anaerobaca lacustris]|uniref:Pilus assembly protein PilM n=1 Tax=Anaerobaca lacustris TaxID=3044600 RepID=A0AAW6TY61_9BACT|nr:pilus assembly protein PilM [Sedimentisphaerales bacterium M17dextr]
MLGTRTILGLAVDEFGVGVAEIGVRSGRPEVRRVGQCVFEEKLGAHNGKALGQTLRQFLRANHFSLKNAAVGIPTKWVVAKEITAPPAGADAMAGLLGIEAERTFSLNAGELIFDYCGRTSTSQSSKVMLLAARRQMVDQIKDLAASAGLHVQSVTVSALAFGSVASSDAMEQRYGVYTRPTYCEFWSQVDGAPRSIKHVAMPATNGEPSDQAKRLTSAIQQLMMISAPQDQAAPYEVTVYDDSHLSDGVIDHLRTQLGPRVTVTDGNATLVAAGLLSTERDESSAAIAAAAVAMAATATEKPAVDFLNPRIGRKKTSPRKRVVTWGIIAGVILLGAVGAVIAEWQSKRADIASYNEQLELIADDVAVARDVRDRLTYAGSWTSRDPRFLECLLQLTLAFPESPRVWATSLALSETAEGSLVGRAVDEQSFYEVLNNIKGNAAFSDVMMMYLRDAGGSAQEKTFAVTFKFQGVK